MAQPDWGKISAIAGVAALVVGGLLWLFELNASVEGQAAAAQMRFEQLDQTIRDIKADLHTKADADDVDRHEQDINDLRKQLEDRQLIRSTPKHTKERP